MPCHDRRETLLAPTPTRDQLTDRTSRTTGPAHCGVSNKSEDYMTLLTTPSPSLAAPDPRAVAWPGGSPQRASRW